MKVHRKPSNEHFQFINIVIVLNLRLQSNYKYFHVVILLLNMSFSSLSKGWSVTYHLVTNKAPPVDVVQNRVYIFITLTCSRRDMPEVFSVGR